MCITLACSTGKARPAGGELRRCCVRQGLTDLAAGPRGAGGWGATSPIAASGLCGVMEESPDDLRGAAGGRAAAYRPQGETLFAPNTRGDDAKVSAFPLDQKTGKSSGGPRALSVDGMSHVARVFLIAESAAKARCGSARPDTSEHPKRCQPPASVAATDAPRRPRYLRGDRGERLSPLALATSGIFYASTSGLGLYGLAPHLLCKRPACPLRTPLDIATIELTF